MWQRLDDSINHFVDNVADFFAKWPGLLPFTGLGLIVINFALQIYPGSGYWIVDVNLSLHLGLVIAILGLLLFRPLG
jgi:hypothetical protein